MELPCKIAGLNKRLYISSGISSGVGCYIYTVVLYRSARSVFKRNPDSDHRGIEAISGRHKVGRKVNHYGLIITSGGPTHAGEARLGSVQTRDTFVVQ